MSGTPVSTQSLEARLLVDRVEVARGRVVLRAAALTADGLAALEVDPDPDSPGPRVAAGSLWLGRVARIAAGLGVAFVDLGTGPQGIVALPDKGGPGPLLSAGQWLQVRVKSEATGRKGPALVHEPVPETGPPSEGQSRCLEPGPDAVQRLLAAGLAAGWTWEALAAIPADVPRLRRAAQAAGLAVPVTMHGTGLPLFEAHDLEEAVAALIEPRVPLPGGGEIVIEPTEALVAVDVNGGERGNALSINLAAVKVLARQMRLRNLGGVVVVDFLTLRRRGDRDQLLAAMRNAVATDSAGVEVYGLSRLGLMELVRHRRGKSLGEVLG